MVPTYEITLFSCESKYNHMGGNASNNLNINNPKTFREIIRLFS